LELSYDGSRAADFANYLNGQTYLIVDRSGTGSYPSDYTAYYASDEQDASRQKIILNNIQWDADGSGSADVFTFGYLPAGTFVISADSTDASCTGGVANRDGVIKVNILSGLKGVNYSIVNTSDTSVHYSGRSFADSMVVDSVPVGSYVINESEIGGFDFLASTASTFRPSAYSDNYSIYTYDCTESFLAGTKDSGAAVGFKSLGGGIYTMPPSGINLPDYGVEKIASSLYAVTPAGADLSNPIATNVQAGDSITVEVNSNLTIGVNGAQVYSTGITVNPAAGYYRGVITLAGVAGSEVDNFRISGAITSVNAAAWPVSNNMTVGLAPTPPLTATATATIGANCSPVMQVQTLMAAAAAAPAVVHLAVYYKRAGNLKSFTAKVTLDNPETGSTQLLVFNTAGALVYQTVLSAGQTVQTADITLPVPGVYIVKAITPEGEYSAKALIR
jgi:hypothetical protein